MKTWYVLTPRSTFLYPGQGWYPLSLWRRSKMNACFVQLRCRVEIGHMVFRGLNIIFWEPQLSDQIGEMSYFLFHVERQSWRFVKEINGKHQKGRWLLLLIFFIS
ncbi:LOW QUALITY PROTEIN: hypothetical protein PanWU01x14_370600 [Parasponia andersonii]|uniref:Uncharacterized protein n=1 Tax=Parasponia andersonii TaxID=3476 RepID=A0A2P5A496_PARAD|nr:LOW QUALITY PROTEIN: hypothetical protein PanWU01x14_370600 [Parasponia andersonii]